MNRELALELLSKMSVEEDHAKADTVLCDLLTALGYQDVVDAYDKVLKWYE